MLEMGNTEEEVTNLLAQTQERWVAVVESDQSVKEYLREHLPFEIYQDLI